MFNLKKPYKEALRCKACSLLIHGLCHEDCAFDCPGVDHGRITSEVDLTLHEFRERKVEKGGVCDQCGQNYRHSVFHCSACGIRLHQECLMYVPKVCGMASDERRGKLFIKTILNDDRLIIQIQQASKLAAMDHNGKSDPYVKGNGNRLSNNKRHTHL